MFHDYISISLPAIFWKNYSKDMMQLVGDMVERSQYDVVIAEFAEMGMYLYRNPYLSAVQKIVSCHRCLTTTFEKYADTSGVPPMLRLKSASQIRVLQKFEFELYKAMDHILTLTDEDRFTMLNYASQLPVSVIHPGIDFDYLNQKTTEKDPGPIVLMCGYFTDKSNHDGALWFAEEVWPKLSKQHPTLQCHFIGAGASHEMKRLAAKNDRMLVAVNIDDLRPYRERATLFINPMRLGSGLRIKVLEAMASGLPVVSTALGAAGIPAQNGVNCFVADTPELFTQSIEWLLNDGELANRMGQQGREMVKDKYNIKTTIDGLERVLSDVVTMDC